MDQQTGSPVDPYSTHAMCNLVSSANTHLHMHLRLHPHIVRDICAFLSATDVDETLSWYVNKIKNAFLEYHYLEPMTTHFCQYTPVIGAWVWGDACGARISEYVYDMYSESRCGNHLCPCMTYNRHPPPEWCHHCGKNCCVSIYHDHQGTEFRDRSCSCDY